MLNLAFRLAMSVTDLRRTQRWYRASPAGLRPNGPLVSLPGLGDVVYVNDSDGFSIELLSVRRARSLLGFEPRHTPRFAPFLSRSPEPS